MGKVTYQFPVKDICGKIGKESNVVFAHRGDTKYVRIYNPSTKPLTAKQIAQHEKFVRVTKAVKLRMANDAMRAQDEAAFAKQTKYKTLYRFLFVLEWNN